MHTPFRLSGLAIAILLAAGARPTAAADQPAAPDPVLVLPDMKVTTTADLPPPEAWRYARIEGFEVLSSATDRSARNLLGDFEKFTRALHLVWPVSTKPLAGSTVILCGRGNRFDQFLPSGGAKDDAIVPSLFLRNREQVAIVVDLETERVTVDDSKMESPPSGVAEYEVEHYALLYREYVHFLLSQVEVRPPVWLEEGLAQIVMDIELDDKVLIYGKVNTDKGGVGASLSDDSDATANGDAVVGEKPFNVVLRHKILMPLAEFFAVGPDSAEARNPLGNNLWAKQAYAFVHFCLFGHNLDYKEPLVRYLQRLTREPASEALFRECFKVGYADMERELQSYIRYTKHKYQKYVLKPDDRIGAAAIDLRDATPAEVGLIKGDALRLAGHPDAAYAAYRDAYLRGERTPLLLAALGTAESLAGHADRAEPFLEAATRAGVTRPSSYVELARLRLTAFNARPEAKLNQVQIAALLKPLFAARQNPPPLPETYELIATAWARSAAPPTADNLAVLDEGIKLFPRDSDLACAAVELYALIGASAKAASIAQFGLHHAANDAAKARLQGLLAGLPSSPLASK